MLYKPRNPQGYKALLTWKQAGGIYRKAKDFTRKYLDKIKDGRLIGHINDSARSVQRNIEEGFKRTTTKEYVTFLGFSRASLEELKRDFEELKREAEEGVRWGEKGITGENGIIGNGVIKELQGLIDLTYGEDCMLGRQISSLERKMADDKTLPQREMIKRSWSREKSADKRFWKLAKEKFGLGKDEKGKFRKMDDKGK